MTAAAAADRNREALPKKFGERINVARSGGRIKDIAQQADSFRTVNTAGLYRIAEGGREVRATLVGVVRTP